MRLGFTARNGAGCNLIGGGAMVGGPSIFSRLVRLEPRPWLLCRSCNSETLNARAAQADPAPPLPGEKVMKGLTLHILFVTLYHVAEAAASSGH